MKNKKLWVSIVAAILATVLILSLILSALPSAHAASSSEIRDQINQMEKDNEKLQQQLEDLKKDQNANATEIKDLIAQKGNIEQQVGLLHEQIKNLNEQISAYNVLLADKQEDVDEAERRLAQLNEKHKDRIRTMEEDGNLSYWSVLFEANSFSDLLDRLNMIEEIASADRKRLDEMRSAAKEVEEAKTILLEERASLQATRTTLAQRQAEMDAKSQEAATLMQQLVAKGEEFEQFMEKAEDDLYQLELEIAKKENEYEDAKYKEYLATLTTPPTTAAPIVQPNYGGGIGGSSNVDESGITWVVPCSYTRVSSVFQPDGRLHPVLGYVRPHNGVDLAAPCPTPIVATRSGIVTISVWSDSAGYYVKVDHLDGYASVYMHMCCPPLVKEGQVVAQGQQIGCVGTTGLSTGNHLHFGISKNGVYVDPMDYIG